MSTADRNFTNNEYDVQGDLTGIRIAIVTSEWNNDVTDRLLEGCLSALVKIGITENHIKSLKVPGSFELPIGAQLVIESCDPPPSAVICLGCVIRGETSHFEYVSQAVSSGIKDVGLKYNIPVIFGVLTDDKKEQSLARSGGALGNKGAEAAVTAVKMALLDRSLQL